jgi:sterol desaturase/sphingolipid hydroxylase (fatty acid hydroxylase superfamily)
MVEDLALFIFGLFAWTFVEYVIHGWLGHVFGEITAALHQVHHRDPHAVFTIGAWLPIATLWLILFLVYGRSPEVIMLSGIVAGFTLYEAVHYRIHFRRPSNACERYLHARHLRHHRSVADGYLGVTSPLWDLIFGTEPPITLAPLPVAPLTGRTNAHLLFSFHYLRPRTRVTSACAD